MTILGREPVLWLALVQALLACGIGFGLSITTEQMALILSATGAILGFVARSSVTPNVKITPAQELNIAARDAREN